MLQELEQDNLQEFISENDRVVVQYGATWCGNCRIMKPKMKRLSNDFGDIKFLYVDAEKLPNSRKLAEVTNLPRSEEHTSELQSRENLVCRLLLEKKNINITSSTASRISIKPFIGHM